MIKSLITWIFIIAYLATIFGFISKENQEVVCKSVDIEVVDNTNNYFIQNEDVLGILKNNGFDLVGEKLHKINRDELEGIIDIHPTIKKAEIYCGHTGKVYIEIIQRKPIVRIINKNAESYYIDQEGFLMPLSDNYTATVIVANGNLNELYHNNNNTSVLSNDTIVNASKKLKEIYNLVVYILQNPFWEAQIQQIYINNKDEYELVPRVGTHIIIFGSINQMEKKFKKLKAVYEQGFSKYGWNNYRIINLKYENQVVCTKK